MEPALGEHVDEHLINEFTYSHSLDQVFINWRPIDGHPVGRGQLFMDVTGGKFPDVFANTELLWDLDVQPAGLMQQIAFRDLTPIVDHLTFSLGELVVNVSERVERLERRLARDRDRDP